MSREIREDNNFRDRLLKNIPSEVLGVYLAACGVVTDNSNWILWVIFVLCLIATPLWMYFAQAVRSKLQITLATLSFVIWAITLGAPFTDLWAEITLLGSALIVVCSGLIFPLLSKAIKN